MHKRDEMMLRINHLGGAKINFRKGANYTCRKHDSLNKVSLGRWDQQNSLNYPKS
jgi:hypothetical protein